MTGRDTTVRSDDALIRAALKGDTAAFTALVRRYEDTVFGFAVNVCRDRRRAQEALQDTFINVYRKLGSFDGRSKFSTWLYTIVTNNCLMQRRRRKIDELVDPLEEGPSGTAEGAGQRFDHWAETPVDVLLDGELRSVLDKALHALPPDYRVVFVLRDMEGKSTEESAAILGLSKEAVKSRLRRARAFLREQLHPYMTGSR
jgi:RNA polymerase sigma-70 factor, ECF subfamily